MEPAPAPAPGGGGGGVGVGGADDGAGGDGVVVGGGACESDAEEGLRPLSFFRSSLVDGREWREGRERGAAKRRGGDTSFPDILTPSNG